MKKFLLLTIAAMTAASALSAKTVDEVRIYLNPGHGSWGPNDRPCATIPYPNLANGMPDTCGFYESNTDLWKVLKLGKKLEQAGFKKENIMYSRVKNGPYPYVKGAPDEAKYNRNLSEICEEVDANNMDVFLSVHSNAATEGTVTNYPLFLYRGTDGEGNDAVAGSRSMAQTMWPLFYTNAIDPQSYYSPTNPNIRGDISFYGSSSTRHGTKGDYTGYLGVLKHGAMGFLSEGFFHTYQPARHRALNIDYCGQEGVRYSRGIIKHFGGKAETTGYIMGTVKDLHEKIVNSLFNYVPGTNDQWLPVNGATVTLNKGGKKVAEYKVDNNYNGVFVFEDLAPGNDYTLDISADGYKPLFDEYKTPIKVTANETTYPMVYLEAIDYEPPKVTYKNYPDPVQPDYVQGVPATINFAQEAPASLNGVSGDVVRVLQAGDTTVILTRNTDNAPGLFLVNNKDKSVKSISTKGIPELDAANPGYLAKISDIALTADGKLVACNLTHNQFNAAQVESGYTRGVFRTYIWDDLDSDPKAWFTSTSSANYNRANIGSALAISGPSNECTVVTTGYNSYSSTSYPSLRFVAFTVIDNTVTSTLFLNKTLAQGQTKYGLDLIGRNLQLRVSPRDDNNYIIDGENTAPFEFTLPNANNTDCPIVGRLADDAAGKTAIGASYFKYAKRALMATPYADDATGKAQGVKLLDVTDGLDKAKVIKTTNTDVTDGKNAAVSHATAVADGEDITILLNGENTVTKMTTANTAQPTEQSAFAYGLNVTEESSNAYTFRYTLTGNAANVKLNITGKNKTELNREFDLGAQKAGENTVTVSKIDIPNDKCEWAIAVENTPVTKAQQIFAAAPLAKKNGRGGVAFVTDTESPAFGKTVVSNGYSQGIDIYSPTLEKEGNYHSGSFNSNNVSSTFRMTENGGKMYVCDWSDAFSGIWMFDPTNPAATPTQLFEGTRQSSGAFDLGGTTTGGSSTGCDFVGSGAERRLIVFGEDYPEGNQLVSYNIGENATIGFAPSKSYGNITKLLQNKNVEVLALDNGMFLSQVRGKGNNTPTAPGFVFADYDGNVLFNSGTDFKALNACGTGIAINGSGNLFAVSEGDDGILVCHLTWDDGNKPIFEPLYHIKDSKGEITQLDFDNADNLLAYNRTGGFMVFSVPNPYETPVATTKAMSKLVVSGSYSAITAAAAPEQALRVYPNPATDVVNVEASEPITDIMVFSLSGARISTEANISGNTATVSVGSLAAGAYIMKVNNRAAQFVKK